MNVDNSLFKFHIKKQAVRNQKYFVYNHNEYPVDFDLLKKNSSYFFNNYSQYENKQHINLINENEEQIKLSEEAILAFIASCQNEPCSISPTSVIPLQYLAYKFEFKELIQITEEFIKQHSKELLFPTILFKNFEGKENFSENSFFDTTKEEKIISENLNNYIKEEEMLSLPIPVLYRIFQRFFTYQKRKIETTGDMTSFLFKCLDKYGKSASILFNFVDFKDEKIDVINRLLQNYSNKFDFNMINSTLAKTASDLASELTKQKEEYSMLFLQMKKAFEEQRSELIKMKKDEEKKQIQNDIQNQERIKKFLTVVDNIKNDVDSRMKSIEDRFEEIYKRQEELIDNGTVKKYHKMILNTITVEQLLKFDDQLQEHFLMETIKNTTKGIKQADIKKNILFYKCILANNFKSSENNNILAIDIINKKIDQLKINNNGLEYLYQQGLLSSFLAEYINSINLSIEIEYPCDHFQQIMDSISDNYSSNIIITINQKDYFDKKFKWNKLIKVCKIGKAIKVINEKSFCEFRNLSVLELSTGVTKIGNSSFEGCTSLTQIIIPESTTSIGDNAFKGCSSLTQIMLPKQITKIERQTFSGCSSLTQITIPSSVTLISESAFYGCTSLTKIIIPESTTSIGDNAFKGCLSLTQMTIPTSVTQIGESCFDGCSKLDQLTIDPFCTSIKANTFNNCPLSKYLTVSNKNIFISSKMTEELYNKNKFKSTGNSKIIQNFSEIHIEIKYPSSNFSNIYEEITKLKQNYSSKIKISIFYTQMEITDKMFYSNYKNIDYIKFDSCVKKTPNDGNDTSKGSFEGCKSLIGAFIPSSFTRIGNYTFYSCSALKHVLFEVPSSLQSIGQNAFDGCSSLTEITIPSSVTSIEQDAFSGCKSLKRITIPSHISTGNLGLNSNITINRI